ncbi:hypothetical protein FKP32DRAFT_1595518 [Trametes sanguinea]|nr:hypothetical protein FKP32DRAFT_1595518 [Trametes sanguinea]
MPLLGETVEASREKRLERQQARFRDRGGIFKPSEHNPLLDLLLSRGVNGESPSRANSPRRSRSRSASPRRKDQVLPQPPERVKAAPAKRAPRKSEAKHKADSDKPKQDTRAAEVEVEEPVPGPSKPTASKRATKGRSAKPTTKQSRIQTANSRRDAEEQRNETTAEANAERPEPVTSKKPGKANRAKKASESVQPAPKPKRAAKRKAASPERTQHPKSEPEHHSDDEPLLKPKKSKTTAPVATRPAKRKTPAPEPILDAAPEAEPHPESDDEPLLKPKKPSDASRSTKAASSSKPVLAVEAEDEPAKAKAGRKRHVKNKETIRTGGQRKPPAHDECDQAVEPEAQRTKGKRKAETVIDIREAEAERASASGSNKSKPPTNSVVPESLDAEEEPPQKARKKRRPAAEDEDADEHDVATSKRHNSKPSKPDPSSRSSKYAAVTNGDEHDSQPPHSRQLTVNEPSSPDLPLAQVSSKSGSSDGTKSRKAPKRPSDIVLEDENEMPPPPPKKRRASPENERIDVAVIPSKEKRKMVIPKPDSPETRVTRPKAPPVFAPKGTVLKPKPRPRLSLFPAPSLEEDSEEDPIDLLS